MTCKSRSSFLHMPTGLIESNDSYMRPATPHAVLTLDDSLTIGGHFYCGLHYERMLYGLLWEHLSRDYITNASHPRSPLLLFKTLTSLISEIMQSKEPRRSKSLRFPLDGMLTKCMCRLFPVR